jgi:glutathione S-transferase
VIRLYRARFSTNVERVALTLALKGIEPVESVWIEYTDRTEVERVSGQPLVPVLDHHGEILTESMEIVRFLDERHPDPPLYPADPAARAEVDEFVEWFNRVWKGPPNDIEAELAKPQPDEEEIAYLAARMTDALDLFERLLSGRDHLLGDDLSAADIAAFPFLKFATLNYPEDDDPFHVILSDRQRDGKERPRLAEWIDRLDALPRA